MKHNHMCCPSLTSLLARNVRLVTYNFIGFTDLRNSHVVLEYSINSVVIDREDESCAASPRSRSIWCFIAEHRSRFHCHCVFDHIAYLACQRNTR